MKIYLPGNGATIRIGREIQCLLYAGFFETQEKVNGFKLNLSITTNLITEAEHYIA